MVYFNCDACGESLKKNQVEKHRYKCRNCHVVSCVDCGHDFRGKEYEAHTKCISEEEKYSGKNYKPRPGGNKGEIKQELWTQQVQQAIDKATDPKLQNVLQQLRSYPNIPRKKAKFENFLRKSLNFYNSALVSKVWEAISVEMQAKDCVSSETSLVKNAVEPSTEPGDSVSEQNGHPQSVEAEDSSLCTTNIKQKSKKRKKDKLHHISDAGNSKDVVQSDISTATTDGLTKSEMKKKKKKHQEHVVNTEVNLVCENGDMNTVAAEDGHRKHKKSAKKRKHGSDVQSTDKSTEVQHTGGNFSKRMKTDDVDSIAVDSITSEVVHCDKFKWNPVIIEVLQQAPDKQLPVKKLRKKILSEFNARRGDGKVYTKEKLLAKFTRKVNRNRRLKVHKDIVTLVTE